MPYILRMVCMIHCGPSQRGTRGVRYIGVSPTWAFCLSSGPRGPVSRDARGIRHGVSPPLFFLPFPPFFGGHSAPSCAVRGGSGWREPAPRPAISLAKGGRSGYRERGTPTHAGYMCRGWHGALAPPCNGYADGAEYWFRPDSDTGYQGVAPRTNEQQSAPYLRGVFPCQSVTPFHRPWIPPCPCP